MPPKKSKGRNMNDRYDLRRRPIGWSPDVYVEKENTSVSSDDSPQKMFPVGSPGSQRKNIFHPGIDPGLNVDALKHLKNKRQEFVEAGNQHTYTNTRYKGDLVDNNEMHLEADNVDVNVYPFNHRQENEFPDHTKNVRQEFREGGNQYAFENDGYKILVHNGEMHSEADNFDVIDYPFNHRQENEFPDHTKNTRQVFRKGGNQYAFENDGFVGNENPVDNFETCVGDNLAGTNYLLNQRQENAFSEHEMAMHKKNQNKFLLTVDKRNNLTKTKRKSQQHIRKKLQQYGKNSGSTFDLECDRHQTKLKQIYPDHQMKSKKNQSSQSQTDSFNLDSSLRIFWIVFSVILVIIGTVVLFRMMYYESSQLNASILVKNLKSQFPDQPDLTFRIIHSALKSVLHSEPKSPAIILLLATNGSESVCIDFASKLVDSLSVPETTLKTFGEDYRIANINRAKKKMDDAIRETLKNNQLGSILLNDLDLIPGQVAIMLHSYCDHENAPFKKAVFVMTVHYDKVVSDYSDVRSWDKVAHDHLLSAWTDLGVDQVEPLLARLTVSVALITAKSRS